MSLPKQVNVGVGNFLGDLAKGFAQNLFPIGGSIISTLFNNRAKRRAWEEANRYNHPAEMLKRLEEAGLNRSMYFDQGGGNAGNAAGPRETSDHDIGKIHESLMLGAQIRKLNADAKLTEAKAVEQGVRSDWFKEGQNMRKWLETTMNMNEAQASLTTAKKIFQDIENEIGEQSKEIKLKIIQGNYDLQGLEKTYKKRLNQKTFMELVKIGAEIGLIDQTTKKLMEETRITKLNADNFAELMESIGEDNDKPGTLYHAIKIIISVIAGSKFL